MKTKLETVKQYGPSKIESTIPAGLRVAPITRGRTTGKYWLDEFPESIFPRNSIQRHDAEHYGITFEPNEVE
jgi:hypothetical protein